jgi:hypothetical protein
MAQRASQHRILGVSMVTDERVQATVQVLDHVAKTRAALKEFAADGARTRGVLANPRLQCTALQWAGKELRKL